MISFEKLRPFLIGTGILAVGVIGLVLLIALRPEPQRTQPEVVAPTVTVVQPQMTRDPVPVRASGAVRAVRQVSLVAEVGGRVLWIAPSFQTGGRFSRGATLIQIDTTDYANAVAVADAEVIGRRYDVIMAKEEGDLARANWERLRERSGVESAGPETELGNLVLREPQQALAEAALRAARARLADAEQRLGRTQIRAPFSGRVLSKQVDAGQYVGPGSVLGAVYASDALEVTVPLQARDAALIPGLWSGGTSVPARVTVDFGGQEYSWEGVVDRVEGAVDAATRTVGAVVRVNRPSTPNEAGGPPLLVGMFASVDIFRTIDSPYAVVPEQALRNESTVWVANGGTLEIRPVEVLQRMDGSILISSGVEGSDRIVVSNLSVFTDGMSIDVR